MSLAMQEMIIRTMMADDRFWLDVLERDGRIAAVKEIKHLKTGITFCDYLEEIGLGVSTTTEHSSSEDLCTDRLKSGIVTLHNYIADDLGAILFLADGLKAMVMINNQITTYSYAEGKLPDDQ